MPVGISNLLDSVLNLRNTHPFCQIKLDKKCIFSKHKKNFFTSLDIRMYKSLTIDLLSQFDKSKQIAKIRLLVEIRIRRHINYTTKTS